MTAEPDLEVPMILNDPEEITVREGIHDRIQAEIYHEDKKREARGNFGFVLACVAVHFTCLIPSKRLGTAEPSRGEFIFFVGFFFFS